MRARKYRVASNDTVLSATRYGPYARLSRIISCRYTVVITDFSVSPYNKETSANYASASSSASFTTDNKETLIRHFNNPYFAFVHTQKTPAIHYVPQGFSDFVIQLL